MKRVLVTAGRGMLGHAAVDKLRQHFRVTAAVRNPLPPLPSSFSDVTLLTGIDWTKEDAIERTLDQAACEVVINTAGLIKQRPEAADPAETIAVNALLPHRLAAACRARGARLIHFSTDCVFSGSLESQRGPDGYRESDPTDARDLYGLSKHLGEPAGEGCLTIRSSLIGPELHGYHGLVSWFLRQPNPAVRGFTRALFAGLSTPAAAELMRTLIDRHPDLHGLWHVAADPISKYDLLLLLRERFGLPAHVEPDDAFYCDRRLDGSRFRALTNWTAPTWQVMVDGIYEATVSTH